MNRPHDRRSHRQQGGGYILALNRNHPTLYDEVVIDFDDPTTMGLVWVETVDEDHRRIETRTKTVSHDVACMTGGRRHPGEHRFPGLACRIMAKTQVERHGKITLA